MRNTILAVAAIAGTIGTPIAAQAQTARLHLKNAVILLKTNIAQERSKPAPQIEIADSPRRPTPFRDKRFSAAL